MSAREPGQAFVAHFDRRALDRGAVGLTEEATYTRACLLVPFDGEVPPVWPVGTKVRWITNHANVSTVASSPFLYRDKWWFLNSHGDRLRVDGFEPVPPEKTWELTGPEVDRARRECGGPILIDAPTREAALAKLDDMLTEVEP